MPAMVDSLYTQAFDAYQQADVQTIRKNYDEINRRYPLTGLMPQFIMLNALSYAQIRDAKGLTDNLTELVDKYPKSEVAPLAEDILKKIKDGQPLLSDGSPITGFDWSLANPGDSTMTGGDGRTLAFSDSLDTEYLLLLMFRSNTIDRNELLYEVADYNFSNYVIQTYDLNFETNPPYDILQIKGFNKFANIRSYLNKAFTEDGLFNKIDTSIVAIPISTDNYVKVLPRLGMEQYTTFFAEHYQDQLPILITHWNLNTSEIEDLVAEVTKSQQEEQTIKETEEIKEEEPKITPEIKTVPKVVTETRQPDKQTQQPVNDKQITADDLLTDDQRQALGKVDDAIKSVEEIISNPVDGIRGLFNKYKNRQNLTKEEKEALKEEERLEKQRQKELKALAKATQDSVRKTEKNRADSIARVEKAVQDSIETAEKQKKEQLRLEEQAKKDAEKATIKAREDERKRKEDERKERIRQQQERLHQQEQERKEKEKAREKERKEKERLQKERQRQREKERDEKEKAQERERKEKEKRKQ